MEKLSWFKSSFSGSSGGNGGGGCVEAARLGSRRAVRDSTDPDGPMHVFDGTSWAAFVDSVKRGEFDLTAR